MGLLDGKVVLVTGAGGGIGRCHALACAQEGARVVVNDLGGARDGTGSGQAMADQVVGEIIALGGEAVSNFDSVTDQEGCERMVQAALDRWGRLDVVVNNAGILRDKTFSKMTDAQWDVVIDVHLNGTRHVTKAALDALKVNGGAIINTSSYSGLIGNFGQSNYGAAKAGIYGFTRVLSMELRKYGITANCVSPVAKTRMTEDIPVVEAEWGPEQISPIVVYLASDLAKGVTGRVFGVQGQRIHLYEMQTNDGVEKPGDALWTANEIHEKLNDITAFQTAPESTSEAGGDDLVSAVFAHFPSGFKAEAIPNWSANLQWVVKGGADQTVQIENGACTVSAGLVGAPTCTVKIPKQVLLDLFTGKTDPQKVFMTGKASADNMGDLMKMGMAFDFEAIAKEAVALVPEGEDAAEAAPKDDGEAAMPIGKRYDGGYWFVDRDEYKAYAEATDDVNDAYSGAQSVAPPMYHVKPFIDVMFKMASDPELDLDMLRLVHAEHDMTFHRTMRHGDVLQLRGTLESVEDKSSGRLVKYGLVGFLDGEVALEGGTSYFIRGKKRKDAGSKPKSKPQPEPLPEPTWSVTQTVQGDQALRYAAASGDDNPIHVDENTAKAAGLPGCILHGLCTMAFAQRDIIRSYCDGDPARLKRLAVRWAKPVFPGEALELKVWEQGDGKLSFVTENAAGQVVMANGRAEIRPAS